MLFMLSILGFRLFHWRHSIDGLPNIKIPVSNPEYCSTLADIPIASSMTCRHRNRPVVQSAHLTVPKRLAVAFQVPYGFVH